jgi:hypothetical protein
LATCCPIRTRSSGTPASTSRSDRPATICSGLAFCLAGPISQAAISAWTVAEFLMSVTVLSILPKIHSAEMAR